MKFTPKYFLIACFLLLLASCSNDPEPRRADAEYFPLRTGYYQIFEVKETTYTVTGGASASSYQLKTEVMDSLYTSEGYRYRIHRYIRSNDSEQWNYLDTWSAMATNLNVIVSEGAVSYVKVMFPAIEGKKWDGNAYNTLGKDEYEIETAGQPADSLNADDCVVVVQENLDDPIVSMDIRREIYGRDIGLVYREISQLSYCTDPDCLGQKQIKDGVIFTQKIIEHGIQ